MAETRVKPILAMSLCLGDAKVRYDGAAIADPFVKRLLPFVDVKPVCPEVEIGLGVPRDPIRLQDGRLVQPSTGEDLTERMRSFADRWLSGMGEVDGFLLKSRSPSCGVRDVKLFRGGQPAGRGSGLFAEAVLARHGALAIEDEARLSNFRIREHFLTKLFALAELRGVKRMSDLVRFQARHKLLLLAYRETSMRALGRVVANPARRRFPGVVSDYRARFAEALSDLPKASAQANVLEHAMGFFKKELGPAEKALFLSSVRKLRAGRLPLSVPVGILRAWLARSPKPYLADQSYLDPYPEALTDLGDSGKGRDL